MDETAVEAWIWSTERLLKTRADNYAKALMEGRVLSPPSSMFRAMGARRVSDVLKGALEDGGGNWREAVGTTISFYEEELLKGSLIPNSYDKVSVATAVCELEGICDALEDLKSFQKWIKENPCNGESQAS